MESTYQVMRRQESLRFEQSFMGGTVSRNKYHLQIVW